MDGAWPHRDREALFRHLGKIEDFWRERFGRERDADLAATRPVQAQVNLVRTGGHLPPNRPRPRSLGTGFFGRDAHGAGWRRDPVRAPRVQTIRLTAPRDLAEQRELRARRVER